MFCFSILFYSVIKVVWEKSHSFLLITALQLFIREIFKERNGGSSDYLVLFFLCPQQSGGDVSRSVLVQATESAYRFTLGSVAGGESVTDHCAPLLYLSLHQQQPLLHTRDSRTGQKEKQSLPYCLLRGLFLQFNEVMHHGNLLGRFFCTCQWSEVCVLDCVYVRRWCLALCLAPVWLSQKRQGNKEVVQGDSLFN